MAPPRHVRFQLPSLQLGVQRRGSEPLPCGLTGADDSAEGHHGGPDAFETVQQLQGTGPLSLLFAAGDGRVAEHHVLLNALLLEASELLESGAPVAALDLLRPSYRIQGI